MKNPFRDGDVAAPRKLIELVGKALEEAVETKMFSSGAEEGMVKVTWGTQGLYVEADFIDENAREIRSVSGTLRLETCSLKESHDEGQS